MSSGRMLQSSMRRYEAAGDGYFLRDADAGKAEAGAGDENHEDGRDGAGQIDALREPAMAVVVVLAAVGLGDQGIEAEQQADAEERWRVEDGVADGDGSDGRWTEAADHDGVDDALGHPAEFAEHDGDGQLRQGGQFPLPLLP
jgi:hypothetical protein